VSAQRSVGRREVTVAVDSGAIGRGGAGAAHPPLTGTSPGAHAHTPALQFCPVKHPRPQAPQWAVVVRRSDSQPLPNTPSQLPKLALHTKPQALPAQYGRALGGAVHTLEHAPQCRGSLARVAQVPEQFACVAWQVTPQAPFEQMEPLAQRVMHDPQWALSVRVKTSQPLAGLPSQSA
jgi:hypothetical protein